MYQIKNKGEYIWKTRRRNLKLNCRMANLTTARGIALAAAITIPMIPIVIIPVRHIAATMAPTIPLVRDRAAALIGAEINCRPCRSDRDLCTGDGADDVGANLVMRESSRFG